MAMALRSTSATTARVKHSPIPLVKSAPASVKGRKNVASSKQNAAAAAPKEDKSAIDASDEKSDNGSSSSSSEIEMQSFLIQSLDIATSEEMQRAVRDFAKEDLREITPKIQEDVEISFKGADFVSETEATEVTTEVTSKASEMESEPATENPQLDVFSDASSAALLDVAEFETCKEVSLQAPRVATFTTFWKDVTLILLWTVVLALGTLAKVKMDGLDLGPPPT